MGQGLFRFQFRIREAKTEAGACLAAIGCAARATRPAGVSALARRARAATGSRNGAGCPATASSPAESISGGGRVAGGSCFRSSLLADRGAARSHHKIEQVEFKSTDQICQYYPWAE